jgi:hypothetical protein
MDNSFIKGFISGVLAVLAVRYVKRALDGGQGKLPMIEYNNSNPADAVQPDEKNKNENQ